MISKLRSNRPITVHITDYEHKKKNPLFSIVLKSTDTVMALKQEIWKRDEKLNRHTLLFAKQILDYSKTLKSYSIENKSSVRLIRAAGCREPDRQAILEETLKDLNADRKVNQFVVKTQTGKAFPIRLDRNATTADVRKELQKQDHTLQISSDDIFIYAGKRWQDTKKLDQMHLTSCSTIYLIQKEDRNEPRPMSSIKPPEGDYQMFAKTLTGKTITLEVRSELPVSELKKLLRALKYMPAKSESSQGKIIYAGKEWEDERTLKDYNFQKDGTIHLVLRLRGGNEYPMASIDFNSLNEKIQLNYATEGPAWLAVEDGLNLYGKCANSNCDAYLQDIWIPKGMSGSTVFDLTVELYTSMCPICKQTADKINNMGFLNCKFELEGLKEGEKKIMKASDETTDGKFLTYKGSSMTDTVKWHYLRLSVQPKTK